MAGALFSALCESLAALEYAPKVVLEHARRGESAARLHVRALAQVIGAAPGALVGAGLVVELHRAVAGKRSLTCAVLASAGSALPDTPGVRAALLLPAAGASSSGTGAAAATVGAQLMAVTAQLQEEADSLGYDLVV